MLKNLLFVATASLCGTTVAAQCATLTIIGTGASGTALTLTIDGTYANQFAFLILGQNQGGSTLPLGPFGTVNLDLAQPWVPFLIGQTNAAGEASVTVAVPASLPASIFLLGQGLTLGASFGQGPPTPITCTTNAVGFRFG
jgi:hypothetical protein